MHSLIFKDIHTSSASIEGISTFTEEYTASMEESYAIANKLGNLAEELKKTLYIKRLKSNFSFIFF